MTVLLVHVFWADAKIEEVKEKNTDLGKTGSPNFEKNLIPPSMQTTGRLDKLSIC